MLVWQMLYAASQLNKLDIDAILLIILRRHNNASDTITERTDVDEFETPSHHAVVVHESRRFTPSQLRECFYTFVEALQVSRNSFVTASPRLYDSYVRIRVLNGCRNDAPHGQNF